MPPDQEDAAWRDAPLARAVADPALVERARAWLERPENRLALEILDLHASDRGARFPHGRPAALALYSDQLANERGIPMLRLRAALRTRALERIAAGRAGEAYADAALLLRLANWIQTELPSVFTWIIGNAVAKAGVGTVHQRLQARDHLAVHVSGCRRCLEPRSTPREDPVGRLEARLVARRAAVEDLTEVQRHGDRMAQRPAREELHPRALQPVDGPPQRPKRFGPLL